MLVVMEDIWSTLSDISKIMMAYVPKTHTPILVM